MEVSICSKGVVERKACRREPLQCYSYWHLLWFRKSWSPELLMAVGALSVTILCFFILVLFHSHLLLASFWQCWVRWSFGSTLTSLFLFPGLLFADCKQEEKANERFSALGSSVRFSSHFPTTLLCPPECKVMPTLLKAVIYYLKLGRAAEEWLSAWFLSHGIRKEIKQSDRLSNTDMFI